MNESDDHYRAKVRQFADRYVQQFSARYGADRGLNIDFDMNSPQPSREMIALSGGRGAKFIVTTYPDGRTTMALGPPESLDLLDPTQTFF